MRYSWIAGAFDFLLISNAQAQSSFNDQAYTIRSNNTAGQFFSNNQPLPVNSASDGVLIAPNAVSAARTNGITSTQILPLSTFASQQDLTQLNQNLSQTDQTLGSQITQAINNLNQSVQRTRNRASQGVAAVSSLSVIPPNPGDRFSVTFGGGEYESQGGGGVSFAYRPQEVQNVVMFGGYARTANSNLFKGGVSFSFH